MASSLRKPIIAGNWKMNKTIAEAVSFVKELKGMVNGVSDREIVVCPPFTALASAKAELSGSNIVLGVQNMHFEDDGAFTGEISARMLKEIGVRYVIIGHSERRQIFDETDKMVNKKVRKALEQGLKPIICVGETLGQREAGSTEAIVEMQLKKGLAGVTEKEMGNVVIAYEPLWAISGGDAKHKAATPEDAQKVHSFIRALIASMLGRKAAEKAIILYGGSMKPENVKGLMAMPDIDGGLVGGASLDAKSFADVVRY